MTPTASLSETSCVLRGTHTGTGRRLWLSPQTAAVRHLHYGRIVLSGGDAPLHFQTGEHETALIVLRGSAATTIAGNSYRLGHYDALYVPRDARLEVSPGEAGCDVAEISAPVEHRYPLRLVRFEEARRDPGLHFQPGEPSFQRDLTILIGKNVEAGRLVAGVTFSEPGNWTSWPPHEHADLLEEAYLFIGMPAPGWGVQLVYTDPRNPELVVVVREGDCVVMPRGYHPNVAAPGGSIGFLWMMAAHSEKIDRQFGVVNVQPEYAGGGSGLDAGRAGR